MSLATMPPKKRHLAEAPNNSGDDSDDYEEAELKVEIEEGERTSMLPPELFTRIRYYDGLGRMIWICTGLM